MLGINAIAGNAAVGLLHEFFESVFKLLVGSLGRGIAIALARRARRARRLCGRRFGCALEREVYLAALADAHHAHLDRLTDGEIIRDVIDVSVRDLGNVDKPAPAALKGDERAEFCDPRNLAVYYGSDSCLHAALSSPIGVSGSPSDCIK